MNIVLLVNLLISRAVNLKSENIMIRKTFTLIEMLVVVAIIGILAGMLMPALQNSLHSARDIGCKSNMKQLGGATVMYIQDYDGWVITAYNGRYLWYQVFATSYETGKDELFACPEEDFFEYTPKGISYGINTYACGETPSGGGKQLKQQRASALSVFGRNSKLAIYVDTPPVYSGTAGIRNSSGNAAYWEPSARISGINATNDWYPSYMRHPTSLNMAMFDGHVEGVLGMELYANRSDVCNPTMRPWKGGKLSIYAWPSY